MTDIYSEINHHILSFATLAGVFGGIVWLLTDRVKKSFGKYGGAVKVVALFLSILFGVGIQLASAEAGTTLQQEALTALYCLSNSVMIYSASIIAHGMVKKPDAPTQDTPPTDPTQDNANGGEGSGGG